MTNRRTGRYYIHVRDRNARLYGTRFYLGAATLKGARNEAGDLLARDVGPIVDIRDGERGGRVVKICVLTIAPARSVTPAPWAEDRNRYLER